MKLIQSGLLLMAITVLLSGCNLTKVKYDNAWRNHGFNTNKKNEKIIVDQFIAYGISPSDAESYCDTEYDDNNKFSMGTRCNIKDKKKAVALVAKIKNHIDELNKYKKSNSECNRAKIMNYDNSFSWYLNNREKYHEYMNDWVCSKVLEKTSITPHDFKEYKNNNVTPAQVRQVFDEENATNPDYIISYLKAKKKAKLDKIQDEKFNKNISDTIKKYSRKKVLYWSLVKAYKSNSGFSGDFKLLIDKANSMAAKKGMKNSLSFQNDFLSPLAQCVESFMFKHKIDKKHQGYYLFAMTDKVTQMSGSYYVKQEIGKINSNCMEYVTSALTAKAEGLQ